MKIVIYSYILMDMGERISGKQDRSNVNYVIPGIIARSFFTWQRSFSNADSFVGGVGVGVNFKWGGGGQSQKRFGNFFSFLA